MGSMPGSLCRAFGVGGLGVLRLGVCGSGNVFQVVGASGS